MGEKFGFLTVICEHGSDLKGQGVLWRLECRCGEIVIRSTSQLRRTAKRGLVQSCGCRRRSDTATDADRLKWIWYAMKHRCYNPGNIQYHDYGGRGITVCERWHTFSNFRADMGPGYARGLTIGRVDNDKPYSPENCRWETMPEQQRNRRDTHIIPTPKGLMVLTDAAETFGISEKTLRTRVNKGWPQWRWFEPPRDCGSRSRYRKD